MVADIAKKTGRETECTPVVTLLRPLLKGRVLAQKTELLSFLKEHDSWGSVSCFWPNPAAGEAGSFDYGPACGTRSAARVGAIAIQRDSDSSESSFESPQHEW